MRSMPIATPEAAPAVPQEARRPEDIETFRFLRSHILNMRRSIRRARPTPREGIEAGLDLMLAAVEERLDL